MTTRAPDPPGDATPEKRKRGRPKGKPLSDAEKQQRRGAPWKHGMNAKSPLGALPPCKKSLCPLEAAAITAPPPADGTAVEASRYPCDVKRAADEKGRGLSACPVVLVHDPALQAQLKDALLGGKLDGLADVTAASLAAMFGLEQQELGKLIAEGFVSSKPCYDKDGALVGEVPIANPRALPTLELAKLLGHTAQDQAITPKSRGEAERDRGIASSLELLQRRARLAAGAES